MPNEFKGRPRPHGTSTGPHHGHSHGHRPEAPADLESLDKRLLALLAQRTRLAASQAASRRERGASLVDPEREKRLWALWSRLWQESGLDSRPLRRLFGMVNALGLEAPAGESRANAFLLTPRRDPVDVDLPGPASLRQTRMWAALAAAANLPLALSPVAVNDPLVELAKGLNQTGAHLSWEEDRLESRSGKGLDFENKLVFAGNDALNFYLLLGLALPSLGKAKFVGGPDLRFLEVDRLNPLLVPLGARLVPLDPSLPGLPARLESGGRMASRLELPEEAPADLARGLALAAWSYPGGLTLSFAPEGTHAAALAETADILIQCGLAVELSPGLIRIPEGRPKAPAPPVLDLDPVLSAAFLAMPFLAGGEVRLTGRWPKDAPAARAVLDLLAGLGMEAAVEADEIRSRVVRREPRMHFTAALFEGAERSRLLPLALALSLGLKEGARLDRPADPVQAEYAAAFLRALGKPHRLYDEAVEILPDHARHAEDAEAYLAPSPWFTLGLCLASLAAPGQRLANPGEMTALWPRFFVLFNSLPALHGLPAKKEPEPKAPVQRKRRVRIP